MGQISLRQVIYIVIGFAVFFACVTLALSGNQFFQVISMAGAATIPIFLFYALVYAFCRALSLVAGGGSRQGPVRASQAPAGVASRTLPPADSARGEGLEGTNE